MGCHNYHDLLQHVGHAIVCVTYGVDQNVAIECEDCHEVILDFDKVPDVVEDKKDGLHYDAEYHRWEIWQDREIVYIRNIHDHENFLDIFNQTLNVGVKAYGLKLDLVVGKQLTTF